MFTFYLFRIRVYPSKQMHLFDIEKVPSEIIRDTILSMPSLPSWRGSIWQIGNVQRLDNTGMYFRLGRTSRSTIELYENGNFIDVEFESAPYTHVLLDVELELCAIAKKTKLAPHSKGIARQFVRLLNESEMNRKIKAEFEIAELTDPEDFISYIRKAHGIQRFWFTFSRPNPFDSADILKPLERMLTEVDAQKGKTEIKGKNLSSEILESIARSSAATGEDAAAILQLEPNTPTVRKRLRENPMVITRDDVDAAEEMFNLLRYMRTVYNRIRGVDGESREQ